MTYQNNGHYVQISLKNCHFLRNTVQKVVFSLKGTAQKSSFPAVTGTFLTNIVEWGSPNFSNVKMYNIIESVFNFFFAPVPRRLVQVNVSGHSDGVTGVKFSPTGHLVASSSRDRSVRLWVPSIKGENTAFKAHSGKLKVTRCQENVPH